jgi:uncharacterized membrane protein
MQPLILIPIIVSPIFIIAGLLLWLKPPKKINHIYGYRTSISMKSQEAWDYAQVLSGKQMVYMGLAYLSTSLLGVIFKNTPDTLGVLISIGLMIAGVVFLFRKMEKELRSKFR